jgi:hypothetical protein
MAVPGQTPVTNGNLDGRCSFDLKSAGESSQVDSCGLARTQSRDEIVAPLTIEFCALTFPRMKTWKRAQVAKQIGKSVATVRRLEGTELFPTLDEDGTHRFNAAEVEAFATRMDRAARPQSVWLRAALARRADEEAEDREHAARLAQQRLEAEAFHSRLAEGRGLEQRAQEERQRTALAEARAELESVRRDLAFEVACASPRDLRRLANNPAFMRTLEDLFGE